MIKILLVFLLCIEICFCCADFSDPDLNIHDLIDIMNDLTPDIPEDDNMHCKKALSLFVEDSIVFENVENVLKGNKYARQLRLLSRFDHSFKTKYLEALSQKLHKKYSDLAKNTFEFSTAISDIDINTEIIDDVLIQDFPNFLENALIIKNYQTQIELLISILDCFLEEIKMNGLNLDNLSELELKFNIYKFFKKYRIIFYCTEACNGDPTFNIDGAVPIIANYAKISNIAEKREIIFNFMKELNGFNEKLLIVLFPYYSSDNSCCYDFTFNIPETFPNIDISPSVYGYGGSGTEVDNFNEIQYSEEDQEYKPDIVDEIEIEEYDQKDPIPKKSVTTVNNDKKDPTQATLNSKSNFFKKSEFILSRQPILEILI